MRKTILAAAILAPALALAHHGWSKYDSTTTLKLSGKILESGYEHPHGFVRLETPEARGLWARIEPSHRQIVPKLLRSPPPGAAEGMITNRNGR